MLVKLTPVAVFLFFYSILKRPYSIIMNAFVAVVVVVVQIAVVLFYSPQTKKDPIRLL